MRAHTLREPLLLLQPQRLETALTSEQRCGSALQLPHQRCVDPRGVECRHHQALNVRKTIFRERFAVVRGFIEKLFRRIIGRVAWLAQHFALRFVAGELQSELLIRGLHTSQLQLQCLQSTLYRTLFRGELMNCVTCFTEEIGQVVQFLFVPKQLLVTVIRRLLKAFECVGCVVIVRLDHLGLVRRYEGGKVMMIEIDVKKGAVFPFPSDFVFLFQDNQTFKI